MSEDFANLVSEAEASINSIITDEQSFAATFEKAAYKVVQSILALHRAGENEPNAYIEFLKERGVEITNRTINPYHPTTAALVRREARRHYRQRITQYAQVACVLAERKVENVADWFREPEKVGSRVLTGLSKATAIYKSLPVVVAHKDTRRRASNDDGSCATIDFEAQTDVTRHRVVDTPDRSNDTPTTNHVTDAETAVAVGYIDGEGRFVATRTIVVRETVAAVRRLIEPPPSAPGNDNHLMEQAV